MKVIENTNSDINKEKISSQIKHIWEINKNLKCPVIGACLSIDEHKKILKKAGYQIKKLKPHQIHTVIMEHLDNKNFISVKTENHLRHKYLNAISKFTKLNEDEFIDKWSKALQTGEIDEMFYVAATRDDLSLKNIGNIFGEVHMLCHANLTEVMTLRHRLDLQKISNMKLTKLLKKGRERSRGLKKDNLMLKTALDEARGLLDKTNPVKTQSEGEKSITFKTKNQLLHDKLKKAQEEHNQQKEHLYGLESEKKSFNLNCLISRQQIRLLPVKSKDYLHKFPIF